MSVVAGMVRGMEPSPASMADPLRAQVDDVRARLFAVLAADDTRRASNGCTVGGVRGERPDTTEEDTMQQKCAGCGEPIRQLDGGRWGHDVLSYVNACTNARP